MSARLRPTTTVRLPISTAARGRARIVIAAAPEISARPLTASVST
jgi:hypothetical protein